ncbi:MAG: hypothetical protein R2702_10515 [Acidimicrobiales bacterium]
MGGDDRGEGVVVAAGGVGGDGGIDAGQVGQRVGREHLELDAGRVHRLQAEVDVHERRAPVAHALQPVVADSEAGRSARRRVALVELGPEVAGRAEQLLEHDVGVDVDHVGNATG